jgi:hypothetical protein
MNKKIYIFEDSIDNERISFVFNDGKWREESRKISEKERMKIKKLPKSKKFGYSVYVGTWRIFD